MAADVVINEFMAANQTTLNDDFRVSSDWIELWNRGDAPADLSTSYLTDDPDNLSKWQFPDATTLDPGQYLVLFASGLDLIDGDGAFHTNFELDAGGGYVALIDASQQVVSEYGVGGENYPDQFGDVSYGIQGLAQGWVATDVPQSISGTETSTIISQIDVAGLEGTLTDVNVTLSVNHTWVSDLDVFLISPQGTRVELFSDVGGSGNNMIGTTLDDDASEFITGGTVPFSGSYRPEGILAALNGEAPNGMWQLEVNDDFRLEGGSLVGWSLDLTTTEGGGSSDDPMIGFMTTPTPGEPNSTEVFDVGPRLDEVTDRIGLWPSSSPIPVTVYVASRYHEVGQVQMVYRINYDAPIVLPMSDSGTAGDAVAGDGIHTAVIPASAFNDGDMVRWAVEATDIEGLTSRAPAFLDQSGEDQSPEYYGTAIYDPTIDSQLDVFQWFIEPGQERRADTTRGTRSTVFFGEQLYDNVFVRLRGGTSAGLPKKSYKFDFNTANSFRYRDGTGRVSEINLNTTYTNKDYIRPALTFETYDQAGVAGSEAFPLRVERNNEFFSVAMFVEQPDEQLLEREGLDPNGALYKMFNPFTSGTSNVEKKTRQYERNNDLSEFVSQMNQLSGEELRNYVYDNVNIPAVMNYLAGTVIAQNNDQMSKNYFLYRDSDGTGEWQFLPWDVDLTFGLHFMTNDSILDDTIWADKDNFRTFAGVTIWPSHPFVGDQEHPANRSWNRLIDKLYEIPEFREMYLRRLRSLMDELLQAPGTPKAELKFEARLDQYVDLLLADTELDYQAWADPWRYGQDYSLTESIQRIKDEYLSVRRQHLYETHSVDNLGAEGDIAGIPHAQPSGIVVAFGDDLDFEPESGDAREEYFTITNANDFAVDLSNWSIGGNVNHVLRKGTVVPAGGTLYLAANARAFRARQTGPRGGQGRLVQEFFGNLPNQGGQLTLADAYGRAVAEMTYQGSGGSPQQSLRVTEINYNPYEALPQFGETDTDNDGFEFIELTNVGADTVSLAGVQLVETIVEGDRQGIAFEFMSGELAPGQRVLVVNSQPAFESRYGTSLNVAGEYTGKLSNGGEVLTLLDGSNDVIEQFRYNDRGLWPGLADGDGATLERASLSLSPAEAGAWQASAAFGGSPGRENDLFSPDVVVNEVLSASAAPLVDQVELMNVSGAAVDISGWYLSDSGDAFKFQIPAGQGTIAPGGYLVFDERQLGFALKGDSDDDLKLVSSGPDGRPLRFVDYVRFPAAVNGVSFGRSPNGFGDLVPMAERTFGGPNSPPAGQPGDLNGDMVVSADDIDFLCQNYGQNPFDPRTDLNEDGQVNRDDLVELVVTRMGSTIGDVNLDGLFNSTDLVLIFQSGHYEDGVPRNSTWVTGDWTCDGEFSTQDLVFAFQIGGYTP